MLVTIKAKLLDAGKNEGCISFTILNELIPDDIKETSIIEELFDFLAENTNRMIHPDFVYADPPYDSEDSTALLAILDSMRYPRTSMIILEHRKSLTVQESTNLTRTKVKKFGRTWVSFFVPTGGDE